MNKSKFLPVLFIAIAVGFSSCKKDDDDDDSKKSLLKGRWKQTLEIDLEYENDKLVHSDTTASFPYQDEIEFTDDKIIYYESGKAEDDNVKYTINGDVITATWVDEGDVEKGIIKQLTSTALVVEWAYEYTENGKRYKEVDVETYTKK